MTVSTDAKILLWRLNDKLRYPIKGHLLARKKGGELAVVGGTCLTKASQDENTFLVGTEGGSVFKCQVLPPSDKDVSHFFEQSSGLRWKHEAMQVLGNLPPKALNEVKAKVERYVKDKGEKDIWAPTVYHAKPDVKSLFTIPFNANYERHLGPVTSITCSPFNKRVVLSCSVDGSIRVVDILNHRPVAVFEPGYNEYIHDVAWSPFRAAVFAAVSNSGNVYIFDLLKSKTSASYVLKHGDDGVPMQYKAGASLKFNPKQRDFLAVGYHDATVRIYRLNYSLSNPKKNEARVLATFCAGE